jgi:transketolase
MSLAASIHAKAVELGRKIVEMTTASGSGHPSSALSIVHLTIELMYRQMRWNPSDPWDLNSDRLVLSEGHAVPVVYAAYADLGGAVGLSPERSRALSTEELTALREAASVLDGHPNPAEGFPFFDAATGSLGMGLSVAAGLALGARLQKSPRHIFVLIGDGESREGQIWEAADFIADHELTNVTAVVNCNGQGQAGYVSKQQSPEALAAKFAAFGWEVFTVDGHDPDVLSSTFQTARNQARPAVLIARTQKGWGVDILLDKSNHGKPVPASQLGEAMANLDATAAKFAPATQPLADRPSAGAESRHAKPVDITVAPFEEGLRAAGLSGALDARKLATRRGYGAALLALGQANPAVVALDADVSNSTFSEMFAAACPERFFECKIAEQNMISTAVGLAAAGYVPFASSFAKFLSRAYDQVELATITRANIKIVGSHSGISLAADGPSQMSLPDVAFFRSLAGVTAGGSPLCVSFQPADAVAAYHMTALMARHHGMCYMRTHRPDVAFLYDANATFEVGGSAVLTEGDAVAVISNGFMIHVCRNVVDRLAQQGIRCRLVDAYSYPLRGDAILAAGDACHGRYVCVEDNYGGGLGSAVSEIVAQRGGGRVFRLTCGIVPKSGRSAEDLLKMTGLAEHDIENGIRTML